MKEKARKKKNSKRNIDLSPVQQNKTNNTSNVIRIKKTKKLRIRPVSEIKDRSKKGRNTEMCTTMASFVSKKKKTKKFKLPKLKLSFDLENSIQPMHTVSSHNFTQDIMFSGNDTPGKEVQIEESKRSHKISSINSENSLYYTKNNQNRISIAHPHNTANDFYKIGKNNSGLLPQYKNAQKPPIGRIQKKL